MSSTGFISINNDTEFILSISVTELREYFSTRAKDERYYVGSPAHCPLQRFLSLKLDIHPELLGVYYDRIEIESEFNDDDVTEYAFADDRFTILQHRFGAFHPAHCTYDFLTPEEILTVIDSVFK